MRLAATRMYTGVVVSKYPRKIPVDADMHSTAGAAKARIVRNTVAYSFATIPV